MCDRVISRWSVLNSGKSTRYMLFYTCPHLSKTQQVSLSGKYYLTLLPALPVCSLSSGANHSTANQQQSLNLKHLNRRMFTVLIWRWGALWWCVHGLGSHLIDQPLPVTLAPPGRIHGASAGRQNNTKNNNNSKKKTTEPSRDGISSRPCVSPRCLCCDHRHFASKRINRARNATCITSARLDVTESSRRIWRLLVNLGSGLYVMNSDILLGSVSYPHLLLG